ncbi:MAG: DegT/DnrJ/EryC1/StrS family aminotransferase [Chloroflexota bacterium]
MIPFINLKSLHQQHADEINQAVQRVIDSGYFILGPEGTAFEEAFASYHGVKYAVGVANGTDAIEIALWTAGVGRGDEVITVSHTAMPTVTAIEAIGAVPILVDIDPSTFTIDPKAIEAAITPRTKAIIPVHIYGQSADMTAIMAIANQHNLLVVEDCAQGHGAKHKGQLVGTFGHLATFSFYPTKNLGAYGDGGAVITNDDAYADRMKRIRFYGQSSRYTYTERGTNSRLDEMQAAILSVKLKYLDEHNARRRVLAKNYDTCLSQLDIELPSEHPDNHHVYHLYVIRTDNRDQVMSNLKEHGVGTIIHYPVPIHLQASHQDLNMPQGSLPITEQFAGEILSLPLYIGLSEAQVEQVAHALEQSLC